jgi:hypothetical protein
MSVTLTFEQIGMIVTGVSTLILIVWRARPYVQGEVQKAVTPIRAELHAWRSESVIRQKQTQDTMRQILDTMQPLRAQVSALEIGNNAGKLGIVRLGSIVEAQEKRVHNLEVHSNFVSLNGAAQKAAGVSQ